MKPISALPGAAEKAAPKSAVASKRRARGSYVFKLFVAGSTQRSAHAIANLRALCDDYLVGRHDLEVVDIFQNPAEAVAHQIVAVPTLLKLYPQPVRCVVGDLSDRKKMCSALNLKEGDRSVT